MSQERRSGGVTGQQTSTGTILITAEQPQGTQLTSTIDHSNFYLKFDFSSPFGFGSAYGILKSSFTSADLSATITPGSSPLSVTLGNPVAISSSELSSDSSRATEFYLPVGITGFGAGTMTITLANVNPFDNDGQITQWNIASGNDIFTLDVTERPVITIGPAENPVGTPLPDEINVNSFFVALTWDRNVQGFSGADISVTSSNTNMTVTRSLPSNIGTAGTTSQYQTELTVTGTGITTIRLTVRDGAIAATGALGASRERHRTYELNNQPIPSATIGDAVDPDGNTIAETETITSRSFSTLFTWDRNIGSAFTQVDVNIASNNPTVQADTSSLSTVTTGTLFRATFDLTGSGAAVVTVFINRGAVPATSTTGASPPVQKSFNVDLGSGTGQIPITDIETRSGPSSTQSGGGVLLKAGGTGSIEPPELDIIALNLPAVSRRSDIPVDLNISFVWSEPVKGFTQATPNYLFIPRESEHGDATREPELSFWSGLEENATYQQTITIQPDSAGEINIFVSPGTGESLENEDEFGPASPGSYLEIFYDTTEAGEQAPIVNISTPPTTYFFGTSYTTTFLWDQPIETGTFTADQIIIDGAEAGALIHSQSDRNHFTMELTLPALGKGEIVITVLDYRVISTAAKGVTSRREGPDGSVSELFLYDQSYAPPVPSIAGGTLLCDITEAIQTNPYLDDILTPNPFGGAFAGTSDLTFIEYRDKRYLYGVVQIIKRRLGTTNTLSNQNEAGAALFEVNLTDGTCRIIKQYAYITIAPRSLTVHQNQIWWFEGSHYGQREKYTGRYISTEDQTREQSEQANRFQLYAGRSNLGDIFSLEPGTLNPVNQGVTRRTQTEAPTEEETNYGYHTQMASPMISDQDNLYMISGFGGQESITSTNYATSRRPAIEAEAETDIRNWALINYSRNIEQRIELFNANGKTGWDALNELARVSNSFIGFDKFGGFYFKQKGGIHANVQSSAPSTIEFKNENGRFPQYGLIAISGELIRYNGLIGRQFLNLERGQYGTRQVSPCENAKIHLIDHVLDTSETVFNPIENAQVKDTIDQIYNRIVVEYSDTTYEYEDQMSINLFGERTYNLQVPLSQGQADWVRIIAQRFINAHKDLHYLINVSRDITQIYDITDTVFLKVSDRAQLNLPCQIYELTHQAKQRKTQVVLRTL